MTKIKIVGIGGVGITILNRVINTGVSGVEFIAIDHDHEALANSKAPEKIEVKSLYSKLAYPDKSIKEFPYLVEDTLDEHQEIREKTGFADAVILVAGLGRTVGSVITPYINSLSKEAGALTVALVLRPCSFEGQKRQAIANDTIQKLSYIPINCTTFPISPYKEVMDRYSYSRATTVIAIACDQLLLMNKDYGELPLYRVFDVIDRLLAQTLCGIIDFLKIAFSPDQLIQEDSHHANG